MSEPKPAHLRSTPTRTPWEPGTPDPSPNQSVVRVREIVHGSAEYRTARDLRDAVLRQPLGLRLDPAGTAEEAEWRHFGAFAEDGALVACVVAVPVTPTEVRLRQMAVQPAWQGRGVGAALLRDVETVLAASGVRTLTLHARDTAVGFYRRLGYLVTGPEFMEIGIRHLPMEKTVGG